MKSPIQNHGPTAAITLSLLLLVLHHSQTAISTAVNTPQPIQPGFLTNCEGFRVASSGETCWGIANTLGMPLEAFLDLNPQLGGAAGCAKNLLADMNYCVRTLDAPPPATSTKSPPPPPKTAAPPPTTTTPRPPATTAPPSCPVNNCYRGFVVATSGVVAAQSSFCQSYVDSLNTETDKEKLAGLPAFPKASCGAPTELSRYCSCWNAGMITPASH